MRVEPIPVEPIPRSFYNSQYSRDFSQSNATPGIITAIGVISIVVAGICMLGGGTMLMANMVVSSIARFPSAATPVAVVATVPGPAELLGPDGTATADRAVIIEGLARVQRLSEAQRQQLDELLAEQGKSVLPISGPNITPEQVVANVSRSRHVSGGGQAGMDYFVLGNGRLELTEDRAVFFPTNGQPSLRSNAVAVTVRPGSVLQPDQIRSVVRAVKRLNGAEIKLAQQATIVQTLQGSGQQLIAPTPDGSDPANEVTAVSTDADDGSLTISTHHGTSDNTIVLDSLGKISSTSNASMAAASFPVKTGPPTLNRSALQWANLLSAIQMALAVYLLVCGIFILRPSSSQGLRMHWIYIAIKLPIGISACVVGYWLWNGFFSSPAMTGSPSSPPRGLAIWFCLPAVIGLIYPIVLLFLLLMSKGIRTHFSAARFAA